MENKVSKCISSIIILVIYWLIVVALIKFIWNGEYSVSHILESMEVVSIIATFLFVMKSFSSSGTGLVAAFITCLIFCFIFDKISSYFGISDKVFEYGFTGIGIIFNIVIVLRFFMAIFSKNSEPTANDNETTDESYIIESHNLSELSEDELQDYVTNELHKQEVLATINKNLNEWKERQ